MEHSSVQTCPPPVALPIIFVPGIMGSRLRNSNSKEIVFDPEDSTTNGLALAIDGPQWKRERLIGPKGAAFSPNYLEVDPGVVGGTLTQERIERGWGGLSQKSYGGFMTWLAHTAEAPAAGQVPKGCFNLHYEAWAHPYNWTDDNYNSGKKLADTVDRAIADTTRKYDGTDVHILKPVIVTHSMGGLVSRAYTQIHGGADKVHGVIHGALPVEGVPATYKRIVAGFENGSGLTGPIVRMALGANRAEATATAANMPGALQLLPSTNHLSVNGAKSWLSATGRQGTQLWSKPAANPYGEIYLNQSDWWRLIYKEHLNPAKNTPFEQDNEMKLFRSKLKEVAHFHARLGPSGFHPNTRMFYSSSSGYKAWDHVEWKQTSANDTPPTGAQRQEDGRGTIEWGENVIYPSPYGGGYTFVASTRYEIQDQNAPGDGTVHAGSGKHVSGPMSIATSSGFEHQYAYELTEARRLTAEWLFDMVEEQL